MEIYKREGSKYWLVDFTVGSKRYRKSTRATTKTRAMEVAADIIKEAQAGVTPKPKGPSPKLQAFVDEHFLPYIQDLKLNPDTKRYYENGWRLLKITVIADLSIAAIKKADIEVLAFPKSGSNANCALRTLSRILSFARDGEWVQNVPKIPLMKEHERSATFTAEQEKALLSVAPQPLLDIFQISQDTGLRPDEVIRMRWENIIWERNLIFNPDGKTDKSRRHVPLSDRVCVVLRVREKKTTSEWVFPSKRKRGTHHTYSPVARQYLAAKKKVGLPKDLVWYSARHTFATDVLDKTGNLALVQKLLGHGSLLTTGRYVHPEIKGVAEILNKRNADQSR